MSKLLEGKVALITGAGRGIGREHALMMAEHGAAIVVNDLGGDIHGEGGDATPAQEVVTEIEAMGGKAVVNGGNVAKFDEAKAMIDRVHLCTRAVSLGGVESLIEHPASMTHAGMPPTERAAAGIRDDLVRLAVGCEAFEDLRDDLDGALAMVGQAALVEP